MCTCYYAGVWTGLRASIYKNFVLKYIYFGEKMGEIYYPLSYTIPWRSGSYTCFSNQSEAENMADLTPSP